MEISIIPEIINSKNIQIFDDKNIKVSICKKSPFYFNLIFSEPYFRINNFESSDEIEIKRIDISRLKELNYRLVAIDIRGVYGRNMKNYPRQIKSYMIKKKTEPLERGYIMDRPPTDHFIEMDITNNRIRLKGRNSYPHIKNENASKWIQIKNG